MRVFKSKRFSRFAKNEAIDDLKLLEAVARAESGLVDADLGGGVIKQRIARKNEGKSGGYRTIILYLKGNKAFFVRGFAKSELENITKPEVIELKELARIVFSLSDANIERLVKSGAYEEVKHHGKN